MIRNVYLSDAEAICNIYNYYIKNTIISFEEILVSVTDIQERIKKVTKKYPWVVYVIDKKIVGYAYANEWKSRSAYRFSVELTVYVDTKHRGKGIGTKLYRFLLEDLKTKDVHSVLGIIALPNPTSIALHENLGFEKVAHFNEIGYKHEKWIDVGYWQYNFS